MLADERLLYLHHPVGINGLLAASPMIAQGRQAACVMSRLAFCRGVMDNRSVRGRRNGPRANQNCQKKANAGHARITSIYKTTAWTFRAVYPNATHPTRTK